LKDIFKGIYDLLNGKTLRNMLKRQKMLKDVGQDRWKAPGKFKQLPVIIYRKVTLSLNSVWYLLHARATLNQPASCMLPAFNGMVINVESKKLRCPVNYF